MVALWMPWIRLRQRQRFGTSTLARPASLHPVLGSSLGTDLIFELGPNLKNLRLDARPCSAGRHASQRAEFAEFIKEQAATKPDYTPPASRSTLVTGNAPPLAQLFIP